MKNGCNIVRWLGWYCRYHQNVQSVIQVVHWVIWESIYTDQRYLYLHDVSTTFHLFPTSQQSSDSDCIVHPSQQKRCSEMAMMYIYTIYSILVFFSAWIKSVGFLLFFFQKKQKTTWRPKKSARSFLRILRWSGGWSFIGSMELLVELFNKKNLPELLEIKKGFRNRNYRNVNFTKGSFVVDDLISGEFWKIWPDSSGEISLTIPTWPRTRNLCRFLVGYISLWYLLKDSWSVKIHLCIHSLGCRMPGIGSWTGR